MFDSDALTPDRIETVEDGGDEDGGGVPAKSSPAAKFPELFESMKDRAEQADGAPPPSLLTGGADPADRGTSSH